MKVVLNIFGSMKTMAVLMSIFAFAIGYATFVENDFGTITAKAEIYNARWFEILLGLLTINLIINIIRFKMFSMKKASILMFHLAFIVIIIGAAVTRYIGYEGTMHIREGYSSNTMLSADTYFSVSASIDGKTATSEESIYLSKRSQNSLSSSLNIAGKEVDVKLVRYIPDVIEALEEAKDGVATLDMMVTGSGSGEPLILKEGEYYEFPSYVLDFNSGANFTKDVIKIYVEDTKLYLNHTKTLNTLSMDTQQNSEINASEKSLFNTRILYTSNDIGGFVLKKFYPSAKKKLISNPNASAQQPGLDALVFDVNVDGKSKEVYVFGQAGRKAKETHDIINGVDVHLSYGAKKLTLPFSIHLNDFQLERYPGSMSPSSYASEVELIDNEKNIKMPYRIYMNNILQHRGYRFFQSSYDQDEKGTILSVNNDPGTLPTYIGYFFLFLGMTWSLFSKHNRFAALSNKAKKASQKHFASILLSLGLAFSVTPSYADDLAPKLKTVVSFDKEHAQEFGKLVLQDSGGRMKPIDTLSTEILAKLSKSANLKIGEYKLTPTQVILGMMIKPDEYRDIKMIRTKKEEINKILSVKEDAKYASFSQFFTDSANIRGYKLAQYVEEAVRKQPKHRNQFDKDILQVDERVNIAYSVYTGALLKIWPKPSDMNNKWFASIEALQTFSAEDSSKVREIAFAYFSSVDTGIKTGDWSSANDALAKIAEYQKFYGQEVYPSKNRIEAEIFYNKANIFERLYPLYLLVGFVLLVFSFIKIINHDFKLGIVAKSSLWLLILFFIIHTIGLGIRWYISGHAPWSNGYESMIYIGWATVLAGFLFSKHSPLTMASTAILTGLILFVAHLNWMDPQVTNLVPVLKSYWLSIHVATITASYGFLGLGALLGFVAIILFILKTQKNDAKISNSIKELNAINEMSLMIGLALLTMGNFLGGVWANESWGRYWGWDPKETWALVTILLYAVVVHLRFIKALYSEFNFAVISLLSYSSVIMTYFGVNYYLAGLHSYAKGDPVPIPDFVPVTYLVIGIVIALAFRNRKLA
ncbi:cytochrome C biogenesis protein [Sulfurimonas lithotrophica]|uniref:Cytochrome C biogenesis protein n=1 Tax=Sulfurimonas lithotrophica TaxID=2590022 RepID=A0A5P8P0E9_9BACT|nr:cytochrome c biogenesis protein CcsA [Sulfurimonas lithotrophica]QFR49169.1 cytochrome C biogenesis protein [Sulfurimonas lithotrophica]